MSKRVNKFATAEVVLAAAVADAATFTVAYPSGTSQLSFNAGLAGSGHYAIVNGNDRWSAGDPGFLFSFDASLITITNETGASLPAGTRIRLFFDRQDGNNRISLTLPLPLLAAIANGDVVTEIRPGVSGYVESWEFVTTAAVTTASRTATLNLEIDTTNVTAGTLVLRSALATPIGKAIAGALITGANRLRPESKLSVEASAVTAFAEGSGYLVVYIRLDAEDEY